MPTTSSRITPGRIPKAVAQVDGAAAESVLVDELEIGARVGRQCRVAPTQDHWPPASNDAGLDLVGRHLSAARTDAFRALGLGIVQRRRDGVRIWDLDGKEYINCRSSGGVFDFGHRPRFAIDALTRALDADLTLGVLARYLDADDERVARLRALARTDL